MAHDSTLRTEFLPRCKHKVFDLTLLCLCECEKVSDSIGLMINGVGLDSRPNLCCSGPLGVSPAQVKGAGGRAGRLRDAGVFGEPMHDFRST